MKENELMVGDFVRNKRTRTVIWVTEIDSDRGIINNESTGYCSETNIPIDDIEPIPLTAEILKKNGFKHYITEEDSDSFDYTEGNLGYVFNKTEYGYMSCIDMTGSFTITGLIKYVHELQHILRLCGLGERADNFKI